MNSIQSTTTSPVIFSDLLFHIFIINASKQFFPYSIGHAGRLVHVIVRQWYLRKNKMKVVDLAAKLVNEQQLWTNHHFFSVWASLLVTDNESLSDCFFFCSVMTKLYITVNQMEHYCCCSQTSQQHMGTQHTYCRHSKSVIFVIALIYQQLWFASRFIFIISSGQCVELGRNIAIYDSKLHS